jgi:hypothetical protein
MRNLKIWAFLLLVSLLSTLLVLSLKNALPRLKEVGGEDNPQWVDAWAVLNRAKGQS